jgi:hypothetical protein
MCGSALVGCALSATGLRSAHPFSLFSAFAPGSSACHMTCISYACCNVLSARGDKVAWSEQVVARNLARYRIEKQNQSSLINTLPKRNKNLATVLCN